MFAKYIQSLDSKPAFFKNLPYTESWQVGWVAKKERIGKEMEMRESGPSAEGDLGLNIGPS